MPEMHYKVTDEQTMFFNLPKTKNLRIKGILRGALDKPLAVMMHGRPGSGNELLQYLGARYLYEQGISSLRLFMYDFEPRTRNLLDCTLQTHADDFDEVVKQLRKKGTPRVFGIGHSYGGITILKAKASLDGVVLWDPTHGSFWSEDRGKKYEKDFPEKIIDDFIIGTAGYGYVTSRRMNESEKAMGDTSQWAAHKGYPLKIISAGKGAMVDLGKRYIDAADQPKQQVVIKGASHQFEDSDKIILELFRQTTSWLKEILRKPI
ncbi:MAG: alpha/beta hydrolase [bacterium]|nr:alpha/beta hydrolase [bacterium]